LQIKEDKMREEVKETSSNMSPGSFRRIVITRATGAFLFLGALFFIPAWTFNYWQAWVYLLTLFVPMMFILRYLYKHDPELLKRRMRTGEKQKTQKLIIATNWLVFLLAYALPGFDHRFQWSNVPAFVTIISFLLVLTGYLFIGLVFKTNSYASRIIEIAQDQKVITTGPYAIVRHPMYLGVLVFYAFSPMALGSYWAVIPALLIIFTLVWLITGEEKELVKNLKGYKEYTFKTKYRLVPGIW
jgi:protein-S-isoprenylcysteine O-methyltransferase Ste14